MKKVLITGASGFIGRHTIPYLLELGYEVHAVSRTCTKFSHGVISHNADLLNFEEITNLIETVSPSHLLHFAWDATPCKYWTSEDNLNWVKTSIHLLQQFVKNGGKRIVFAGTCAEYNWENELCIENETPLTPTTLYGTCKAALFKIVDSYCRQIGFSMAWGRIFFLYGPHEYSQRLVPTVINSLLQNEVAKCSHGMQIRDFLHVEDAANAFVTILNSEIQGPINIGSGIPVTLKKVVNLIAAKLNTHEKVQFGSRAIPTEAPCILANTDRLFNELKWHPKHNLETGLDNTIDWWSRQLKNKHKTL